MSLATLLEAAQFIEQQERVRGDSESIVFLSRMGVLMESSQVNQSRAGQGFRPVDCYLQMYDKQPQSLQQQHQQHQQQLQHVSKLQHQQLNVNRIQQQQQLSVNRIQQQGIDKLQQQQIVDKLQHQQLNVNRIQQQQNADRLQQHQLVDKLQQQQLNVNRLQQQQLNVSELQFTSYVRQQNLREPYHIEFPQHYIKEESEDIDVEELDVVAVSPRDRVTCVQSSVLVRPGLNGIASPLCGTVSPGSRANGLSSALVRPDSNGSGGSPLRRKYEAEEPAEASGRPPSPRVTSMPPPKKKWMKNYMEEEPCPPAHLLNGASVARTAPSAPIAIPPSPGSAPRRPAAPSPSAPPAAQHLLPVAAYLLEHDLPRARSNSNGSGGRAAGTREVHNKLEKNRRAHLKECFEQLKHQLPASPDDKKSSNLSILDSAIKYIQVLKRRERECEHEMERLAREKISSQQRLAALRRGSPVAPRLHHPSNHDRESIIEEDNIHSLSRVASPGSCSSLSMMHSDQMSPSPRVSPPLPPLPSSLDLSTRPLRPTQPPQQPQMLYIQPNGIYPRLEQSPPPSIISRAPPPSSTLIPFSHHLSNGLTGSIVATPGTLNLTVNPSSFNSVNTTHVFNTSPSHFNSAASFNANQSFNNASFNSSFNASVSLAGKVAVRPANQLNSNGGSLPTLTVTTVNHGQVMAVNHGATGIVSRERKILSTVPASVNGQTTIVHPAQLHLPLQQMMNGSGIVVSPAIQFYTTPQTLRVLQGQGGALAPIDLPSTAANSPIQRMREVQKVGEAGTGAVSHQRSNGAGQNAHHHIAIKPQPEGAKATLHAINQNGSIMMNGLTPLVVSKGGTHIITSSQHLAGKMVNGPLIQTGHQLPMAVSAQFLGSSTVKPVVVVSSANHLTTPPPSSSC